MERQPNRFPIIELRERVLFHRSQYMLIIAREKINEQEKLNMQNKAGVKEMHLKNATYAITVGQMGSVRTCTQRVKPFPNSTAVHRPGGLLLLLIAEPLAFRLTLISG